jgi:arylsulfatase A-like enzyme
MTEEMDRRLGEILAYLDELGIAYNTYVIYTSDNGGEL